MSFSQRNARALLLAGALVLIAQVAAAAAAAADSRQQDDESPEAGHREDDFSQKLIIARHPGIAGFLLADAGNYAKLNKSSDPIDSLLADLLDRVGPDMRPMRGFRDFSDITPEVAARAWLLMHDHAQIVLSDRMQFMKPLIKAILREANVSGKCSRAALNTIESAKRLDSWAIQLLAAWGNFPPVGIFEGTFGDIGSYHGCLNVPRNSIIGHAHYCTISYRPVLAPSQSYELIVRREPAQLLALFNRHGANQSQHHHHHHQHQQQQQQDKQSSATNQQESEDAFSELLRSAQYHHYVYYKLGTCFPIDCDPFDVQKLAKLVGHRAVLMSGPVKCHSKYEQDYEISADNGTSSALMMEISTRDLNGGLYIWKPHITGTQMIALIIVSVISLFIIIMTLVDLFSNILPQKYALLVGELSPPAPSDFGANGFAMPTTAANGNFIALSSKTSAPILPEFDANNNSSNNNNNNSPTTVDGGRPPKKVLAAGDYNLRAGEEFIRMDEDHDDDEAAAAAEQAEDGTRRPLKSRQQISGCNNGHFKADYNDDKKKMKKKRDEPSLFRSLVDDFSIFNNMRQYFHVSESQTRNEIGCINGIRCITMSWIITNHTMQYNDWSAFARTREIETLLKSLVNQPLFNGSYLVDTFFLISGLLTSYSTFKRSSSSCPPGKRQAATDNGTTTTRYLPAAHGGNGTNGASKQIPASKRNDNSGGGGGGISRLAGPSANFSPLSYLVGRYLRLTPQIVFVSLLFILLPLMAQNGGPHWYTITGEYSENCAQNWWVNLLHIQAFYRSNEMCNFVSWWISVDMFYHLFALGVILLILNYGPRMAPISCAGLIIGHGIIQASRHYRLKLPPNLLSTIPQTGAMWSEMTLDFFWTPCAHALPYFLGFYLGHVMAREHSKLTQWFSPRRALTGWSMVILSLTIQSYSTYFWVTGDWRYTPLQSTVFHLISALIWSLCLVWIIVACQFKHGSFIDQFLSCKLFAILSKASYVVYLSHFLILFTFFGSQNLLLEPTRLTMLYIIVGNVCFAMLFGSILCFVYEMPWLKTQRRLMRHIR